VQGGQRGLLTYGGGQRTASARFYLREASLRLSPGLLIARLPSDIVLEAFAALPSSPPALTRLAIHSPCLHAHDSIVSTIISCGYAVLARFHLVPFMHGVHDISSTAFTATTPKEQRPGRRIFERSSTKGYTANKTPVAFVHTITCDTWLAGFLTAILELFPRSPFLVFLGLWVSPALKWHLACFA